MFFIFSIDQGDLILHLNLVISVKSALFMFISIITRRRYFWYTRCEAPPSVRAPRTVVTYRSQIITHRGMLSWCGTQEVWVISDITFITLVFIARFDSKLLRIIFSNHHILHIIHLQKYHMNKMLIFRFSQKFWFRFRLNLSLKFEIMNTLFQLLYWLNSLTKRASGI